MGNSKKNKNKQRTPKHLNFKFFVLNDILAFGCAKFVCDCMRAFYYTIHYTCVYSGVTFAFGSFPTRSLSLCGCRFLNRKKYKPKAAHISYVLLYVVQVNRVVERGIHSQLDIIYIWVLVTLIVTLCADCCCFPIFVFHFFYILFHISIFLLESRAL